MERKQGFFSAAIRGISPSRRPSSSSRRSRSQSPSGSGLSRRSRRQVGPPVPGFVDGPLSPLREGPDPNVPEQRAGGDKWPQWLCRAGSISSSAAGPGFSRSDLRLLLGVLGAPLAPVHVSSVDPFPHLSIKDTPIETSSAHYILQQYLAATGGQRLQSTIHNAYVMGKIKASSTEIEPAAAKALKTRSSTKPTEHGGFVLWQMNPDMWYVELALGGSKVHAGCNGRLVWRHTPWLGSHAAKGPVRPLRRALQGLDPRTTASLFAGAKCTGEKEVEGEDCFVLKLTADPRALRSRSEEGPAEVIRHVVFGYFSSRTGLLVRLEDSHLTRVQSGQGDVVYWETTIESSLKDYRAVEGLVVAHSGRSVATLFRFGDTATSHTKTRMEEAWSIEEVEFNVPGLSNDCFIPPADVGLAGAGGAGKVRAGSVYRAKVGSGHGERRCFEE